MAASQLKQALYMALGFFILIWPCYRRAWVPTTSTINLDGRAPRMISKWKSEWLNSKYGNREDGVSAEEALIWAQGESTYGKADKVLVRVYYRPNTHPALRAWLWSAWRNSVNELSR